MIGGLPLLSTTRDPDYNSAVITLVVGVTLLVVGLLMIIFDSCRQRRELKRGELNATGVFWNSETRERLEGLFHFNVDPGTKIIGEPEVKNKKFSPVPGIMVGAFFLIMALAVTILDGIPNKDWGALIFGLLSAAFGGFIILMVNRRRLKGDQSGVTHGFKHRCHSIQQRHNQSSKTPNPGGWQTTLSTSPDPAPILKMVFTVNGGMTKAEFGGSTFTSRSYTDLDTVIFTRGSITRLNAKKAKPLWLCEEVGTQLHELPRIHVQVTVDRDLKSAVTTPSSNAGVKGALLGGAIGGAIGATMDEKREKERRQQLVDHQVNVTKLFNELREVAERFGWTANIQ
jgi:hypothetical protein